MKTLTIHSRTIPCRESTQYIVTYDNREYRNGHSETIENPRLRVPFRLVLQTRSKPTIKRFLPKLGKTNADKWLCALLLDLMDR